METAEQPKVHSPSRYFKITEQNNVIPLDPITGEALRAGTIPESLLADEELRKGYDFLHNNASRIRMGVLLSRHGEGEDLVNAGINLSTEAEDLARKQGVLFLEGAVTTDQKSKLQQILDHITSLKGEQVDEARQKLQKPRSSNDLGAFRAESFSQITGTQVEVAQPDYTQDSDRPADVALTEWKKAIDRLDKIVHSSEGSLQDTDTWYSLNAGFTVYRDWYLIGKIGSYLSDREARRGRSSLDGIAAKLLVGPTHNTIGKHLEGFGIPVDYAGGAENKHSLQVARFTSAVGDTVLTQQVRIDQVADIILEQEAHKTID